MKTILVDALHCFILKKEGIFMEMYTLLEKFPHTKVILTNANKKEQQVFGMINLPYTLFSLEHKPNKTDPIYFKKLLVHLNLSFNEVIYFEHNKNAIISARSLGIKTFFYNQEKKDLIALEKFLKNNI